MYTKLVRLRGPQHIQNIKNTQNINYRYKLKALALFFEISKIYMIFSRLRNRGLSCSLSTRGDEVSMCCAISRKFILVEQPNLVGLGGQTWIPDDPKMDPK